MVWNLDFVWTLGVFTMAVIELFGRFNDWNFVRGVRAYVGENIFKINTQTTPTLEHRYGVLLGCDGSVVWKGLYGYNAALTMMGIVVFMGRKNWWKALLGTA
jgi:hypothetical protein